MGKPGLQTRLWCGRCQGEDESAEHVPSSFLLVSTGPRSPLAPTHSENSPQIQAAA